MTATTVVGLTVRPARDDDAPAMTALYNRFVATSIVNFDIEPFTLDQRRPWFRQFADRGPYRLFVADLGGVFAGYAGSMRHKEKRGYDTTVETTVYIDPACSGRRVGTALYERLFESPSRGRICGGRSPELRCRMTHRSPCIGASGSPKSASSMRSAGNLVAFVMSCGSKSALRQARRARHLIPRL